MITKILGLVESYKSIIESGEENSELYKWKAIQHFQNTWNIEASDFHVMFKEAFKVRENLMFHNSYGFLNKIASNFPEETRSLFINLLDDSVPLENRITNHQKKSDELLVKLKEKLGTDKINHQQDERTISIILTLHNPEKYYLYKDNVYKALCMHLKVSPENKAGKKYFHFESLADPLLDEIRQNEQIQTITKAFIPGDFPFDSTKLIFQDIIYRTLVGSQKDDEDFKDEIYRITDGVREELIKRSHPLAKHIWYNNDAKDYRQVSVFPSPEIPYMHYEIMRRTNSISWEFHPEGDIDKKDFLQPFVNSFDSKKYKKVDWKHSIPSDVYVKGNYHKIVTKYPVKYPIPEAEYANAIIQLTNQFEELYADTNNRLIEFLKENGKTNELPSKNINTMNIPLNQILYGPPGTGKTYHTINHALAILKPYLNLDQSRSILKMEADKLVKQELLMFTTFHQSLSYEDFIEGIKPNEPELNDNLTYSVQPGIFKKACAHAAYLAYIKAQSSKVKNTGYTFDDLYENFISHVQDTLKKNVYFEYPSLNKKVYEIYAINKNQSIKARSKGSTSTHTAPLTKENIQKLYDTFSTIDEIQNYDRIEETVEVTVRRREFYAVFAALKNFEKSFKPDSDGDNSDSSITRMSDEEKMIKYNAGVFNSAIREFGKDSDKVVLIIDEINRGNVSQIFGELITLLEEDKRLGNNEELEVILPYSKSKFSVPPNLHIIGTMNTADRSVEALDTALRRRFTFVEMLPNPEAIKLGNSSRGIIQLGSSNETIDLCQLLTVLNKRIEVLVDRDHTIGHSFFMTVSTIPELKTVFDNKIIPLLQEYFYGDYSKMEMVIGSEFFEKTNSKDVVFAVKNPELDFEKVVYKIKNLSESEFLSAIQKLITGVVKQ